MFYFNSIEFPTRNIIKLLSLICIVLVDISQLKLESFCLGSIWFRISLNIRKMVFEFYVFWIPIAEKFINGQRMLIFYSFILFKRRLGEPDEYNFDGESYCFPFSVLFFFKFLIVYNCSLNANEFRYLNYKPFFNMRRILVSHPSFFYRNVNYVEFEREIERKRNWTNEKLKIKIVFFWKNYKKKSNQIVTFT